MNSHPRKFPRLAGMILLVTLLPFMQGAAAPPLKVSRRQLAWPEPAASGVPAILAEYDTHTAIQITLPEHAHEQKDSIIYGWALTRDNTVLAATSGWGSVGNAGATSDFLIFDFKPKPAIAAFVLHLGDEYYLFKVKPRTPGLSDDAQWSFDTLSNIDPAQLAAYESANGGNSAAVTPLTKYSVEASKKQLADLGYQVRWNEKERRYLVSPK
jgi:hypothetical protein